MLPLLCCHTVARALGEFIIGIFVVAFIFDVLWPCLHVLHAAEIPADSLFM